MTIINGTLVDDVGLGSGLSLSGSTLSAEWTAGAVSAIGSGLTLSGGTLSNTADTGNWNNQTNAPASGGTVTVPSCDTLILTGTTTLATLTL